MEKSTINKEFLVPDQLWEQIEPLLPPEPPKPKGGRPMMDNRFLNGLFRHVLRRILLNRIPALSVNILDTYERVCQGSLIFS